MIKRLRQTLSSRLECCRIPRFAGYTERLFSEHLRDWLDDQGWEDISFNGLKYAAAGTLNEAGASVATIVSVIGNATYAMALKYLATREEQHRAGALMEEAARRRGEGNVDPD